MLSVGAEVEGLKRDSTGDAYFTVSYRPAKTSKGNLGVVDLDGSVDVEEEGSSGRRVKWAILAEGFFCHS